MVIPGLQPFNEISSRSSYGAIPSDHLEEGEVPETDDEKPRVRRLSIDLMPQQGEVIDEVSITANTINALLGVSLFTMPWGFQQAGVLGGIVILSVVGFLSFETTRMLLIAQKVFHHKTGEVHGYPEIAACALGPQWANVVRVATITSCLGGCTGYLIVFGEVIGQALSLNPSTVIYVSVVPLILFSWVRSFRELTVFTVFGVIALVIAAVAVLVDGSKKMDMNMHTVPLFEPDTFLNFLGPATFLFTIHYFILALGAENLRMHTVLAQIDEHMAPDTKSALVTPIALSYVLSVVMIIILGGTGFVMYRSGMLVKNREGDLLDGCEDPVCQNVILNLSPGIPRDIVGVTMSLVILLSYILIFAPAREHVEKMFLGWLKPSSAAIEMWSQNVLRAALVLLTVTLALGFPYSASMLGAVGGLTDSLQCFVLPPLIYQRLGLPGLPRSRLFYSGFIILWGVGIILYTIFFNIMEVV